MKYVNNLSAKGLVLLFIFVSDISRGNVALTFEKASILVGVVV